MRLATAPCYCGHCLENLVQAGDPGIAPLRLTRHGMWNFLSKAFARERYSKTYPVRADRPVYAVGDVHGRADLLEPLLEKILQDALAEVDAGRIDPDDPAELVFLGDLIDRGPDTRSTMELVSAVGEWPEFRSICLLGNHEAMVLRFLDNPVANKGWLRYGGYETLLSYEVPMSGDLFDDAALVEMAPVLRAAMGPHVALLQAMVPSHVNGTLLFTHAGADPAVPPEMQRPEAMIWGVKTFGRVLRKDGIWVVHGHTVVEQPVVRRGVISVDTGAYMTGALTALKVIGGEISFLTQQGSPALEPGEGAV